MDLPRSSWFYRKYTTMLNWKWKSFPERYIFVCFPHIAALALIFHKKVDFLWISIEFHEIMEMMNSCSIYESLRKCCPVAHRCVKVLNSLSNINDFCGPLWHRNAKNSEIQYFTDFLLKYWKIKKIHEFSWQLVIYWFLMIIHQKSAKIAL